MWAGFALHVVIASVVVVGPLEAQRTDSVQLAVPLPMAHGRVVARGVPLDGVNVFDLATLEGTITHADGKFAIPVRDTSRRSVHLSVRRIGYKPADLTVTLPADSIVITLEPLIAIPTVTVVAGRFTASAERTAELTPLEVMTTPGGGDVNSAVKTLPGVQNADEASGLFVRGGDYTETRTFIEGAPMFTPYQPESPTGSVAATINPFLTDGITFAAGGFGPQWGNALSGIVDLHPQGRAQSTYLNTNATILSAGVGGALRMSHGLGFGATAGFSDLSALFALNGNPREYQPPPRGSTFSLQGVWEYSRTGHITLFGLRQNNAMGIQVDDPAVTSTFTTDRHNDIALISLYDTLGAWRPFVALSTTGLGRTDTKSAYDATSALRSWQARAETEYQWSVRMTGLVGVETERLSANYDTRFPTFGYDPGPSAPTSHNSFGRTAMRDAEYLRLDAWPLPELQITAGARTDRSGYATARTVDPRLSTAWHVSGPLTVMASWGMYHQVADPTFVEQSPLRSNLPALRARMSIVGAQLGDGSRFARLELWQKSYGDLVGLTRDFLTASGLSGGASGADLFARSKGPAGTHLRLSWSVARSRRTDPDTGLDAPAPFDITNSVTGVIERDWSNGWHFGVSQRFATGRPFTDVTGAAYDSVHQVYAPMYALPNAARLPMYSRADIAISRATRLSHDRFLVLFGAIQNPLNTVNLYGYTWTRDYATRVPVRTAINRTVFFGANLVMSRKP